METGVIALKVQRAVWQVEVEGRLGGEITGEQPPPPTPPGTLPSELQLGGQAHPGGRLHARWHESGPQAPLLALRD